MNQTRIYARQLVLDRITAAFIENDRKYIRHNSDAKGRLKPLLDTLKAAQKNNGMACSLQHYYEAKWLLNYSDEWQHFDKVCAELKVSLCNLHQPDPMQAADGSWGPCYDEWYRKLEPTVDALQLDSIDPATLGPLTFMSSLQDADYVVKRLHALKTSDIAETGRNNRDEYGAMLTALSQLLFKQKLLDRFARYSNLKFTVSAALIAGYKQFLWDAQDGHTGYWGPLYIFGPDLAMIPDLSFTFHVVHYYMEDHMDDPDRRLPNLGKIVGTTLAIKDQEYPNGWLNNKQPSDHNNYDVAVLFACGWNDATAGQQKDVQREIQKLSDWCLTSSLQGDHFQPSDMTVIESYYYGVRFLDTIGLWDPARRFWHNGPIPLPQGVPSADEIRANLRGGFAKVKDSSEYSQTIAEILG